MRLRHIALQDFRNVALCALEPAPGRVFLLGANGQGKTNLLEAAGLASALRSFRTQEWPAMVRRGSAQARVLLRIEHETDGEVELEIRLGARAREAVLNGAPARLGDLLGRFPVVSLSSDDMRLLRGPPGERRRAFDLLFSSASDEYFTALRRYHGALKSRNELLRAERPDDAQLAAFEAEMSQCAESLVRLRTEGCATLAADVRAAYAHIDGGRERPDLAYAAASADVRDEGQWRALFARNRAREKFAQKTVEGPHRDDYRFLFEDNPAREFASEGQQRALVVSWRLAQAHWLERARGIRPVLIADDILGELDPARRAGFWRAVSRQWQVLASGTTLPADTDSLDGWQIWNVRDGVFSLSIPPV